MAKIQKKEKSMEEALWESANKLRGSVEPSEYKHVVLSLIFLKYAYDKFEGRRSELIKEGKGAYTEQAVFYNAKNVFYLREVSLMPSKYIEFKNRDEGVDFDTKMRGLQGNLTDQLKQEAESRQELFDLFKELGYGIG